MTEKNALAELAETLKNGYVSLVVNDRQVATFTTAAFPELDKAQRIVAELAKVDAIKRKLDSQMPTESIDVWSKTMNEWVEADRYVVDRCRAIAEEGVNNGK